MTTPIFSPYIFAWGHNNVKHYKISCLSDAIEVGVPSVTLGFLTSDRYDEILEWEQDIRANKDKINVILSIGGATGVFPSINLTYYEEIEKLHDLLVRLGINMIDLDIEGSILESQEKIMNWIKVISGLVEKRRGCSLPELWISLTLPVEFEGGLNNDAITTIKSFNNANINISIVNLMLMDYYTPLNCSSWGVKNVQILKVVHRQLKHLFHHQNDYHIWNKMGICPMIGENDDGTKFTIEDWEKLIEFAKTVNIGLITFWAINRDQKTHLFKMSNVNTHSKCQSDDCQFTNKAMDLLKLHY